MNMDSIDDASIDPKLAFSLSNNSQNTYDHFTNIEDDDEQSTNAVNVATAAMMNFDQTSGVSLGQDQEDDDVQIIGDNHTNATSQESLSFLQNALKLDHDDISSSESTPVVEPRQKLIRDSTSNVSLVMVNPAAKEGTNRLGRPRRAKSKSLSAENGQDSSLKNLDKSLISRFRVDSKPVSGPGSRGGRKKKYGVEKSRIRTTKVDSLLKSIGPEVIMISDDDNDEEEQNKETNEKEYEEKLKQKREKEHKSTDDIEEREEVNDEHKTDDSGIIIQDKEQEGDKEDRGNPVKRSSNSTTHKAVQKVENKATQLVPSTKSFQPNGKRMVQQVLNFASRKPKDTTEPSKTNLIPTPQTPASNLTTCAPSVASSTQATQRSKPVAVSLSSFNHFRSYCKNRVEINGPLSPFYYDNSNANFDTFPDKDSKKLAFGYPIKYSPFAADLIYILSFYFRFKDLFIGFGNLGIQDLEEGLGLSAVEYENIEKDDTFNLAEEDSDDDMDINFDLKVTTTITNFFNRLIVLVLNKEKSKPKSNLIELVAIIQDLGIPSKWRSEKEITQIVEDLNDPVDPNNAHYLDYHTSTQTFIGFNDKYPLKTKEFLTDGLDAIEPEDRLLLLKCLCSWCLSNSNKVRTKLNEINNLYDSASLETYYIPKIFRYSDADMKRLINKEKKVGADGTTDIFSDIKTDPLWFRMIPFLVGDGTTNSGNFHLVKLQDYDLNNESFRDFSKIDKKAVKNRSSDFKLYVEDYVNKRWFEVCDNVDSLKEFVAHIEAKFSEHGTEIRNMKIRKVNIIKENLQNFIDIIERFEATKRFRDFAYTNNLVISNVRATRLQREKVNYNEDNDNDDDDEDDEDSYEDDE